MNFEEKKKLILNRLELRALETQSDYKKEYNRLNDEGMEIVMKKQTISKKN